MFHLRGQGVLGTLEDLPGYDDSTGLGSPDAPQFIADFVSAAGSPPPTTPEVGAPVLLLGAGGLVAGLAWRRRRRPSAAG